MKTRLMSIIALMCVLTVSASAMATAAKPCCSTKPCSVSAMATAAKPCCSAKPCSVCTKGAIVLFDGSDLSQWTGDEGQPAEWEVAGGVVKITPNSRSIITKRQFEDFRMHIEFNVPGPDAKGRGTGNSGVYIQRRYEVQILNSYGKPPTFNGCGSLYRTKAPIKNACKEPGQWQCYDIIFTAAKWSGNDKVKNARITVWQNGVLTHDDFEIPNKTGAGQQEAPSAGPILLQNHGSAVRFRNIWITPMNETGPANTLTETEKRDGWELLFDGKTSSGWTSTRQPIFPSQGWTIHDGMIIVNPGGESAHGGDIITAEKYSDFDFKMDFKITKGANSGIKYFCIDKFPGQKGSVIGLEFQILDDDVHLDAKMGHGGNRTTSSLYDLIAAKGKKINPVGQWNTARIVSKGLHVEHWLNGRCVLQYERGSKQFLDLVAASKYKDRENFGMAKQGCILLQDHGDEVAFRNIKIKTP